MNPYEILGVPQGADEATIKKAYKELAKKYHPDQYMNNPLSALAEQKMKEVNNAYDTLMNKGGNQSSGYNSGNSGYSNTNSGSASYITVRSLISSGRLSEADAMLDSMQGRDAQWHYLKGIVALNSGWYDRAMQYLNQAINMDPSNPEYRAAMNSINNRTQGYRSYGNGRGYNNGNGACNCCTQLVCADCCCELMGGDLISCC